MKEDDARVVTGLCPVHLAKLFHQSVSPCEDAV
jgi:hypothetical protein